MNEPFGNIDSSDDEAEEVSLTSQEIVNYVGCTFYLISMIYKCYNPLARIYPYFKSKQFKEKTKNASKPKWLAEDLSNVRRIPKEKMCIYTKQNQILNIWFFGKDFELKKIAWDRMWDILVSLDLDVYDISMREVCIISIPKRNFESGLNPGEFIPKYEGSPENYFEYQMIGNDNIQVTRYVVNGISYVAGICIYIETPYTHGSYYNMEIIKSLMNEPDCLTMNNSGEISMEVYHRMKNCEPLLITRNGLGIENHWKFNGDKRQFESITPIHPTGYIMNPDPDGPKTMKIKYCHSKKNFVMVSKRNGNISHAEWDKTIRRIQYSKCETCNEPEDVGPPSYRSVTE